LSNWWCSTSHWAWLITLPCRQILAIWYEEIECHTQYECN
jgi:hypothetical protein